MGDAGAYCYAVPIGPMQTVSGPVHVAAVSAHGGLMSRYSILLPVSFYTP